MHWVMITRTKVNRNELKSSHAHIQWAKTKISLKNLAKLTASK